MQSPYNARNSTDIDQRYVAIRLRWRWQKQLRQKYPSLNRSFQDYSKQQSISDCTKPQVKSMLVPSIMLPMRKYYPAPKSQLVPFFDAWLWKNITHSVWWSVKRFGGSSVLVVPSMLHRNRLRSRKWIMAPSHAPCVLCSTHLCCRLFLETVVQLIAQAILLHAKLCNLGRVYCLNYILYESEIKLKHANFVNWVLQRYHFFHEYELLNILKPTANHRIQNTGHAVLNKTDRIG